MSGYFLVHPRGARAICIPHLDYREFKKVYYLGEPTLIKKSLVECFVTIKAQSHCCYTKPPPRTAHML
ncbi:MAG TPA: hypothetical protein VD815_03585 [Candidatus Saccharimonadales bacterium]|nr:hypothetical protein [Candidatus Saccharimonadales bacterium]